MELTRRQFGKSASTFFLLLAVASSSLWSAGCAAFSNIVAWVGVGIQTVTSIVNLLTGGGIMTTAEGTAVTLVLGLIKTAFADVQAAVSEYDNAPSASKASTEGKITTALQALADQLQKFWSDLNIPDVRLAATVQGLIGILLSTIAGFMATLPPPTVAMKSFAKMIPVRPQKRSAKQFVHDVNALLTQNGYSQHAIH